MRAPSSYQRWPLELRLSRVAGKGGGGGGETKRYRGVDISLYMHTHMFIDVYIYIRVYIRVINFLRNKNLARLKRVQGTDVFDHLVANASAHAESSCRVTFQSR